MSSPRNETGNTIEGVPLKRQKTFAWTASGYQRTVARLMSALSEDAGAELVSRAEELGALGAEEAAAIRASLPRGLDAQCLAPRAEVAGELAALWGPEFRASNVATVRKLLRADADADADAEDAALATLTDDALVQRVATLSIGTSTMNFASARFGALACMNGGTDDMARKSETRMTEEFVETLDLLAHKVKMAAAAGEDGAPRTLVLVFNSFAFLVARKHMDLAALPTERVPEFASEPKHVSVLLALAEAAKRYRDILRVAVFPVSDGKLRNAWIAAATGDCSSCSYRGDGGGGGVAWWRAGDDGECVKEAENRYFRAPGCSQLQFLTDLPYFFEDVATDCRAVGIFLKGLLGHAFLKDQRASVRFTGKLRLAWLGLYAGSEDCGGFQNLLEMGDG